MIDFHDFLIGFLIFNGIVCYLCFLIRNFYAFSLSDGFVSYIIFIIFCFFPVIPEIMLTINVAKKYFKAKKQTESVKEPEEKPRKKEQVKIQYIHIRKDEDIEKALQEIAKELKIEKKNKEDKK